MGRGWLMTAFLAKHGYGFLLHMAGTAAIMTAGYWAGWLVTALVINTLLWPVRELKQRRWDIRAMFTVHTFVEWVPAVLVGLIMYAALQ